jgi:hypothetical protein
MGRGFLVVVLSCLVIACGDDDLEFGTSKKDGLRIGKSGESALHFGVKSSGGQSGSRRVEDTVVQGNLFNVRPATARPILIFVFVDLRDPGTFQDFRDAEVGVVEEDRSFTVSHLADGDLTVVFLLDQVGVNQDGTIDPGDPIAVFEDTTQRLKGLSANTEVTLEDVDVNFNFSTPNAGIAKVRSEANIIVRQE